MLAVVCLCEYMSIWAPVPLHAKTLGILRQRECGAKTESLFCKGQSFKRGCTRFALECFFFFLLL